MLFIDNFILVRDIYLFENWINYFSEFDVS